MHAPTDEQAAFRKASVSLLEAPRGIIKSTAGAGCGKTTALKGAVQDCNRAGASRLLVLAYSKPLIAEVQSSFGNLAVVRTFNSLAFEAVRARSEGRTIGQLNASNVIQAFDLQKKKLPINAQAFAKIIIGTVSKFCSSADSTISALHVPAWVREPVVSDLALRYATVLFDAMRVTSRTRLPLPHDLYVKDWHLQGCPGLSHFDQLFLDEAQDASDVMLSCLAFAKRACYVGDAGQQIFAFRGSQDAMLKVPGREFPLTLSFRFGPQIADLANRILECKSSPPPIKLRGLAGKSSRVGPIATSEEHTRIFRTNTALIRDAITLRDLGESFSIVGDTLDIREKTESVFALMRNAPREAKHPALSSFRSHDELAEWASDHPGTETAQIYSLARDYELREDDLLRVLAGRGQSTKGRITLTTCHKAKGREFPNVIVREDFDYSLATAKRRGDAQLDEELNLLYVAATRAKQAVELQVSEIII